MSASRVPLVVAAPIALVASFLAVLVDGAGVFLALLPIAGYLLLHRRAARSSSAPRLVDARRSGTAARGATRAGHTPGRVEVPRPGSTVLAVVLGFGVLAASVVAGLVIGVLPFFMADGAFPYAAAFLVGAVALAAVSVPVWRSLLRWQTARRVSLR